MGANEDNLFKSEGYALMAAAFEVYNQLGPGFLEEVYQEAFELQLGSQAIPFVSKPRLEIQFKGRPLKKHYEADLLVHASIIVELKAIRVLAPEHEAQLLNELKASRLRVGYLINFGATPRLQWLRRVDSSVHQRLLA
ncbi:MAG: GxxExxY protein [Opitutaceae bacterium]|nr:GxxExxY protein [Opitutaceae bacterium]MBP9913558.1 GxxExxY protein [Opitutaceae bacterium]